MSKLYESDIEEAALEEATQVVQAAVAAEGASEEE